MSILIKGMEMPTEDEEIIIRISSDGMVMTEYALPITGVKAGTVPPHGRLIDADAVSLEGGPYEYDKWCKWALKQYQAAPTIIPASEEAK